MTYTRPSAHDPRGDDDASVYWLLLVVGAAGVAGELIRGGTWGAEPTMAAILAVFAARALVVRFVFRLRASRPLRSARS